MQVRKAPLSVASFSMSQIFAKLLSARCEQASRMRLGPTVAFVLSALAALSVDYLIAGEVARTVRTDSQKGPEPSLVKDASALGVARSGDSIQRTFR